MEERLDSMSLTELREYAKAHGIMHISSLRKQQLIDRIEAEMAQGQKSETQKQEVKTEEAAAARAPEQTQTAQRQDNRSRARGQYVVRRDNNGSRDNRDNRDNRDSRDNRDNRDNRDSREGRDSRSTGRDSRENREQRTYRRDNMQPSRQDNERTASPRQDHERSSQPRQDYERSGEPRQDYERSAQQETAGEAYRENAERMPVELSQLDSGNRASGVLEIMPDGYGFLRSDNYMSGENDIYVAPSQIRKFGLRTGDIVSGTTRLRAQQERFSALLYVNSVNGMAPSHSPSRRQFENMTPIFPDHRIRMERGSGDVAARIVDLIAPVGRGQRGMIVSPPKAGKTTLLKEIARSILANDPMMHILIVLIDERPEEVTDIREAIVGDRVEVLDSTFDEEPSHHIRVAQMGIERAKRLVEYGENVTILLDSITRLARASNLTVQPSGRTLSGGLDPAALHMPKRFFGAARNMREGGSLTILATALVDTGSKMDDMVFEEFKGTGNMELVLDRKLSERRVFPAIDIQKSSTRREDLLLTKEEQEAVYIMRKALNGMKGDEATENILNTFVHTKDNEELVAKIRRQRYV